MSLGLPIHVNIHCSLLCRCHCGFQFVVTTRPILLLILRSGSIQQTDKDAATYRYRQPKTLPIQTPSTTYSAPNPQQHPFTADIRYLPFSTVPALSPETTNSVHLIYQGRLKIQFPLAPLVSSAVHRALNHIAPPSAEHMAIPRGPDPTLPQYPPVFPRSTKPRNCR